jgi:deoxyribonuclease IV
MDTKVGFHVSIAGGISNSVDNALRIGCKAFQIFSRNPRGWAAKQLKIEDVKNFQRKLGHSGIHRKSVFVHMPYLPNLSAPDGTSYNKSVNVLTDEIQRCSRLDIHYLVLHLGSTLGKGSDSGISQLVKACNFAFDNYYKSSEKQRGNNSLTILLENSAGQKNSIGSKFEEIRIILDKLNSNKFGICLDTCHAFAAGYDLRTEFGVNTTIDQFHKIIGLKELKMVHLNDSKDKINSNRDRHEHIGLGKIGEKGFRTLFKNMTIRKLPVIMETPNDERRYDSDNLKALLDFIA